jgi:hypothetical protein
MRIKKLMNDSFYVNSEDFADVNSVDSLSSDLYFHYTKDSGQWKLSGNTTARASGIILEDSTTTSIVVTPHTFTSYVGNTAQLAVVNQNGDNVITECVFNSSVSTVATVSATGLITIIRTGTTTITATHNDGPTDTTPVIGYWPIGAMQTLPLNWTGTTTGETKQLVVYTQVGSHDITSQCTFVASGAGSTGVITVNGTSGLVTFVGNNYTGEECYITTTHTYSGAVGSTLSWYFIA